VRHLLDCGDEICQPDSHVDIRDAAALRSSVMESEPEAIYHLAAIADVGLSWREPEEGIRGNTLGTWHLLEAASYMSHKPRVLIVGSAEVYGKVRPDQLPVDESAPLRPVTPYAASKAASEMLGIQAWLGWGVPTLLARPFNHFGPGQSDAFVVGALSRRIVEAMRRSEHEIPIGNLSARRDFTDVRDVVRAYRGLVTHGAPGEAYNVCSGRDVSVRELAERMLAIASADLSLVVDDSLLRPVDVPVVRGDYRKVAKETGWAPEIALEDTLQSVIESVLAEQG